MPQLDAVTAHAKGKSGFFITPALRSRGFLPVHDPITKFPHDSEFAVLDDPRGTGGTPYMQWLKQLIDETLAFKVS